LGYFGVVIFWRFSVKFSSTDNGIRENKYLYFARIQFLSYFLKQTSGEIPVVFDFKFSIYDKKRNIGHEHLFFSNHLKSTKIKQSSFGKHQKLNTPRLNIHILTENRQNITTPIYPNLRYCQWMKRDNIHIYKYIV
jgi:hypothetical protein